MSKFVLTAQLQLQAPRNANQVLNQVKSQLSGVQVPVSVKGSAQAIKQVNNLTAATQKANNAAQSMGKSFGLAIKRFAAFTVASRAVSLVTNTLAGAVDEAIEFQREMVKISQVTGKTVKELKGLQQTITNLSVTLGTSSKDLLAVTRILSQAGIRANELEVALASLAKTTLAPTFEDIEKTAEGAVAIISQFGQGVGALEKQLGAINAVAGQFAVESGDLIGAVRRFGGVFKSAGGSLEELLALFTSVRATTRESSESISTGLRTIFTRIQRPKTIEFLKQFGVELLDVEGKFVGPFEAAKRLSEALSGLGEGDITFIRIAEELGGFRQIGKVIPLLQQFEVAERARQAAIAGGESLTRDAATAQQALSVQITKVKEEFLALVRSISETASFQLFARTALEIASNLIKVADAIKPLIPLITALAAIKFARGFGGFLASAGSAIQGKNQGGRILGFNSGGLVPGQGNRDTVPAMLSPGEFVIRKSSVQKMGASTLAAMNNNRYAFGGRVGILALQGDGGMGPSKKRGDVTTQEVEAALAKSNQLGNTSGNYSKTPEKSGSVFKTGSKGIYNTSDPSIATRSRSIIQSHLGGKKKRTTAFGFPLNSIDGNDSPLAAETNQIISDQLIKGIDGIAAKVGSVFPDPVQANSADQDTLDAVGIADIGGKLYEAAMTLYGAGGNKAGAGADFDYREGIGSNIAKQVAGKGGKQRILSILEAIPTDAKRILYKGKGGLGEAIDKKAVNYVASLVSNDPKWTAMKTSISPVEQKAAGGGIGGTDTVPALLTPGEFVINKSAAQSIGYSNLNSMNRSGVARYAKGGPVQMFNKGGGVTAKEFKKELAVGGNAALGQDIAALSTDISGIRKSLQEAKDTTEYWSDEERQLAKRSKDLSDAVYKLEQTAEPGAKGQKALNRLYTKLAEVENQRIAAEQKAISSLENQVDMEDRLAAKVSEREKKIDQARSNKQKAKDSLTTGTQTTFKDSGMNKTANIAADKKAADAANKKAAADSRAAMSIEKFTIVAGGVMTALAYLRPTIDENSGALAKGFAFVVDSATSLVAGITTVIAALAAFGVQLNAETAMSALRGAKSFFTGGGIGRLKTVGQGAGRSARGIGARMMSGGRARGGIKGFIQKDVGKTISRFGKGLTKLGPKLFNLSKFLGPVALAAGVTTGAFKLLTGVMDYFSGVHKKAAEAIEKGNTARAGELAVSSRLQKDANNAGMAMAATGAAVGQLLIPIPGLGAAIGGVIGALGGLFLKTEQGQKAMASFRDSFLVLLGGDSTKTIAAQAKLQASVNKLKLEEAKNTEKASQAMKDVEAGSRSLIEAFSSGDLTGNLKNQLGVFEATQELEASKMADLDKQYQGGGIANTALGFATMGPAGAVMAQDVGIGGVFKEMGAMLGMTTSAEEDRKASAAEVKKANDEFTKQFKENGEILGKVAGNIMASDPSLSIAEVKKRMLELNPAIRAATDGMEDQEREDFLDNILKNRKAAQEKQLALLKAMNFGMQAFADRLKGTVSLMENDSTLDQSGGTSFDRAANVIDVALTSAANTISDDELDTAIGTLKRSMADAGASAEEIESTVSRFKSLNEFNKNLNKNSAAFQKFQQQLKDGATPREIIDEFGDAMTEGMGPEAKEQIKNALEGVNLEDRDTLLKLGAGDLSPLTDAVGDVSEEFKKQISDGLLRMRGSAEKALIASIKQRKAAEDEYVAAQRKAIDTQLEAAKVFEDFGGKALSGEEKLGARMAQFNAGAAFSGTGGLSTGSASDIRRVAGQIGGNFGSLQQQATIAATVGGTGAFDDRSGAEADNRERLKKQNEALLQFTKQRISLLKEELAIVQKKNAAEKSALEKLLSGDIEGFIEGQSAAGAAAALRTGDAGLTGLFGAGALGAGFQTLEGQGLSDAQMQRAGGLALGGLGVKDDRAAQILSGTTVEEEAIKSQGRELAGVMGELAQQSADFERAEISAKEAIINIQQARLDNISAAAQAQGLARGGVVYANRGMFIPRGTDTVPAMLTPGEFVVNRGAVNRGNNLQILRAMNSGGGASAPGAMSGGGKVNYYNLGGIVEGIGSAITNSLPGLEGVFSQFAASVDKLIGTKFNVALDTTNVNVNFNGASFLETLKDDIKTELLEEVSQQIKKAKPNTSGDLDTRTTVLGN